MTRLRTLLLLVAACAAGCSSSSATGSGSNGSGSAGSTAPPPGTVLGGGHFTIGKKVSITSTGFDPQVLYTPIGSTVTWTNRSDGPQSVHFDNWDPTQPVDSGSIPPGGTWKFTFKTTGSVVYHSTQNPSFRATVQIRLTE